MMFVFIFEIILLSVSHLKLGISFLIRKEVFKIKYLDENCGFSTKKTKQIFCGEEALL
jgi:hypothetical protein